jgi:hypothetical protein
VVKEVEAARGHNKSCFICGVVGEAFLYGGQWF